MSPSSLPDTAASKIAAAALEARHLPRALGLVWAASRRWTLAWIALLALQGALPAAIVYLTRDLVNGIVAADIAGTVMVAAIVGGLLLLAEALHGAADWVRHVQSKLVEDHINGLVHLKSTSVDLAFYESPDYHDHLHRARAEAAYRPVALLENCGAFLQHGITLFAMAGVLLPYGWWIPAALFASTLPAFAAVLRFAVRQHHFRRRVTPDERRASYYDWLMTDGSAAAELRLFGLGNYFHATFQALRARLRGEEMRLARSQGLAELVAGTAALLVTAACLAWVGLRAMHGEATLGDLALFYQAFSQGQRLMRSILGAAGQLYYNLLFLGNLFAFLDLESRVRDPAEPRAAPSRDARRGVAIRFRDVTFRYPGSEADALRGLDLAIPAGQVAAVVGPNGAGKSTLVKLLCRFYDPQAGRVEVDGIDLRDLAVEDVRALVTVLFQEPLHFNASVAANIAPGPSGATRGEVEAAARAAGAERLIARLPEGYESLLGKWFAGGVELSTGEWQRLALARAFLRDSRVLLLDEPTSAMDSWAEADWVRRLRTLATGRTAIIVTHRFTTAMQADVIYVMDGGRVAERGSHAELVRHGGAYAQSWSAQMRAADAAHAH